MHEAIATSSDQILDVPPGFQFNVDSMSDYIEQVAAFAEHIKYQEEPIPSFEHVPQVAITPTFNPTGAPVEEIYAHNRTCHSLGPRYAPHSEFTSDPTPVTMWRIVERSKVADGTGLVSSRVLLNNSVGNVENFDYQKHLVSNHASRTDDPDAATPFVSFSTDPSILAEREILRLGFGIRDGRDPIIVKVEADPSRVITSGEKKEREVLLVGGVAPSEYTAAYEVADFIANVVPTERPIDMVYGEVLSRDEALRYWQRTAPAQAQDDVRGTS